MSDTKNASCLNKQTAILRLHYTLAVPLPFCSIPFSHSSYFSPSLPLPPLPSTLSQRVSLRSTLSLTSSPLFSPTSLSFSQTAQLASPFTSLPFYVSPTILSSFFSVCPRTSFQTCCSFQLCADVVHVCKCSPAILNGFLGLLSGMQLCSAATRV